MLCIIAFYAGKPTVFLDRHCIFNRRNRKVELNTFQFNRSPRIRNPWVSVRVYENPFPFWMVRCSILFLRTNENKFIRNSRKRTSQIIIYRKNINPLCFSFNMIFFISSLLVKFLIFNCEAIINISQKNTEGGVLSITTYNFLLTCCYRYIIFPVVKNIQVSGAASEYWRV